MLKCKDTILVAGGSYRKLAAVATLKWGTQEASATRTWLAHVLRCSSSLLSCAAVAFIYSLGSGSSQMCAGVTQ